MASEPKYKRVLLKLSGESLCAADGYGVESSSLSAVVDEVAGVLGLGVQLAIVPGGGNFIRARDLADDPHVQRVTADYMGMLGTVINALALRDAFAARGVNVTLMSALPIPAVAAAFNRHQAIDALADGSLLLLAGGTGHPFFTTDTTAALRASEVDADLIIKATKVEGVYNADPMTDPEARKYDTLTYHKALADELEVMDQAAFSICAGNHIPIIVCRLFAPGNLVKAVTGQKVGTLVTE